MPGVSVWLREVRALLLAGLGAGAGAGVDAGGRWVLPLKRALKLQQQKRQLMGTAWYGRLLFPCEYSSSKYTYSVLLLLYSVAFHVHVRGTAIRLSAA